MALIGSHSGAIFKTDLARPVSVHYADLLDSVCDTEAFEMAELFQGSLQQSPWHHGS